MGKKAVLFLLVAVLVGWGFKQTEATASVAGPQRFTIIRVQFNNGFTNPVTQEEANWAVFDPENPKSCQSLMLTDSEGRAWLEGEIYPTVVEINYNPGSLEDHTSINEAWGEALKVILPLLPEPKPNIIIMASGGPGAVSFAGGVFQGSSSLGVAWIGISPGTPLVFILGAIRHEVYHVFGVFHCKKFPENTCRPCDLTDPACISLANEGDETCVMGNPFLSDPFLSDEVPLCGTHRRILFGSSRSITVTDTADFLIEPRYSGGVTLIKFSSYEIEYSGGELFLRFMLPPDIASVNAIDAVRIRALKPGEFCVFPDGSSVEFLGETPQGALIKITVSPVATTTTTTTISATTTTTATTTTLPCQCVADSGCISGQVINGAGKTVALKKKRSKMIVTAIAGTDGCYKFTGLQDGTYKVKVRKCKGGGAKTVNIANGGKVESLNFNCR